MTVDVCDVGTGLVRQVLARGEAEVLPFDVPRGRRLLSRYLGPEEINWDARFRSYLHDDPEVKGTVWVRMVPKRFVAEDLGYRV
ncbi:hypothetical protein [Amycolatopsis sp. cmx-11-12]|uniref:hypothetical protein n=1 Tax=Amycolatopsis sp. cmx-11-12 TaxID=2785795 RepID=UPI003916E0E4